MLSMIYLRYETSKDIAMLQHSMRRIKYNWKVEIFPLDAGKFQSIGAMDIGTIDTAHNAV
jgi:hypothetical protein